MASKSFIASICIVLAFVCLPTLLLAQPGGPGPDPDPGTDIPFDGGITMLIAAGIGYATKKAYDKRKEKLVANKEK